MGNVREMAVASHISTALRLQQHVNTRSSPTQPKGITT